MEFPGIFTTADIKNQPLITYPLLYFTVLLASDFKYFLFFTINFFVILLLLGSQLIVGMSKYIESNLTLTWLLLEKDAYYPKVIFKFKSLSIDLF